MLRTWRVDRRETHPCKSTLVLHIKVCCHQIKSFSPLLTCICDSPLKYIRCMSYWSISDVTYVTFWWTDVKFEIGNLWLRPNYFCKQVVIFPIVSMYPNGYVAYSKYSNMTKMINMWMISYFHEGGQTLLRTWSSFQWKINFILCFQMRSITSEFNCSRYIFSHKQ